jgi:hypothetical protein
MKLQILLAFGLFLAAQASETEKGRQCFDHKDNDGDGRKDCDDPDCMKDRRVAQRCKWIQRRKGGGKGGHDNPNTETGRECFDHKDNDGDGKSDCQDTDCMRDRRVAQRCKRTNHGGHGGKNNNVSPNGRHDNPHTETRRECFDHKDNDGDGKSDCEDPDCTRDRRIRQRCQRISRTHGGKTKKERGRACFDGKDNDGDGIKDCADPDCQKDRRVGKICKRMASKGNSQAGDSRAPANCVNWYDGCNSCRRQRPGAPMRCSKRMCFRKGKAACRQYAAGTGSGNH